jgi:triacylglycerol esterase/lipase EstA (alpha/beta hydrolase family)
MVRPLVWRAAAMAVILFTAWGAAAPPSAAARTDTRDKVVVFLHGYNGRYCTSDWRELMLDMRSAGFTGPFYVVRYLSSDSSCDLSGIPNAYNASLFDYGSHGAVYGHTGTTHDNNTDVRHLSWHLSHWIRDFIPDDPPVDVVAHSMGGLILRFSLAKERMGDWPALRVEDAVTLGTPHGGVNFSKWIGTLQGQQMEPGSFFINWLASNAQNPQGVDGTQWSLLGSQGDLIVGAVTATKMGAPERVRFGLLPFPIGHADYMHVNGSRDSSVWNGSAYVTRYTYGPMSMIRGALQYSDW